jgi:hypothetical protein
MVRFGLLQILLHEHRIGFVVFDQEEHAGPAANSSRHQIGAPAAASARSCPGGSLTTVNQKSSSVRTIF